VSSISNSVAGRRSTAARTVSTDRIIDQRPVAQRAAQERLPIS
jgi:hypothetical protein